MDAIGRCYNGSDRICASTTYNMLCHGYQHTLSINTVFFCYVRFVPVIPLHRARGREGA